MLAKRLAALVVAIALVAGALWLRSRIDGDSATAGPGGTTTVPGSGPASSTTNLVCITELAEVCRAAAAAANGSATSITVEAAGTTIDRLAAAEDPGEVAWLTLAPLPQLVDDLRSRAGLVPLFVDSVPIASSKLVLVGRTPQMGVLAAHCGGAVTWTCLGDAAGRPWSDIGGQAAWGAVQPAHEAPASSATGLLSFANAVVGFFGRADLASADLESDAFTDWVRRLERSIPSFGGPQGTPFEQFLLLPQINVVATTEAEVNASAGARRSELTVAYPAPMAQADVVLATSAGTDLPDGVVDELATASTAAGWESPSAASPGGLPSPGLLQALRQLWSEVTR